MLQGKYLKYTEDITFDIFKKIVNKLEGNGWKDLISRTIEEQFKEFTENGYLIYCGPSYPNNYSFYANNVICVTDKEIKISDIIGRF